ncbi:MAG TPA: plastocyanin/azurin family copper-binding protein [Crenalkalicoccus sp.]|nr:plastocyanin/azurin family copper-binding protein [Crenalkalicoccus sp.]
MPRLAPIPRRLLLGAALLGVARPVRAAAAEIVIEGYAFHPEELHVTPGTEVTWRNQDDEPHSIVSSDTPRAFRSPLIDTGETFSVRLEKPGRYGYYCTLHPHMTAQIVVA